MIKDDPWNYFHFIFLHWILKDIKSTWLDCNYITMLFVKNGVCVNASFWISFLNPKKAGGSIWPPSLWFFRNCIFRGRVNTWFFVAFDIISYIYPENFIKVHQVVQKIWRFAFSILTIFANFSDFLTFTCCKKNLWCQYITDDVSRFLALTYSK